VIPSINLGSDGPILNSLFFISNQYLSEIEIRESGEDFDYVALNSIFAYRILLSESDVKKANDENIQYQIANITLLHTAGFEFRSVLNYVGEDREKWIQAVLDAIPISTILST